MSKPSADQENRFLVKHKNKLLLLITLPVLIFGVYLVIYGPQLSESDLTETLVVTTSPIASDSGVTPTVSRTIVVSDAEVPATIPTTKTSTPVKQTIKPITPTQVPVSEVPVVRETVLATPSPTALVVTQTPQVRPTLAPLAPEERDLIMNGPQDKLYVALTFDAGQSPDYPAGYDKGIERVLIETQTPATIFLGGDWMQENQLHKDKTKELYYNPLFELGNHGFAHLDFASITVAEMHPEIDETQRIMWELTGFQPTLFRFPYGTYTEEALEVVQDHGLRAIQWDVVSGDPDPNITAEAMIPWVLQQVQPGSIIIMHMNGRGWHTAEALPTIIETLKGDGYEFVTVSELLGLESVQK